MSFPSLPTNNQQAIINGTTYIYSATARTWTRISSPIANISISSNLTVANANVTNNLTANLAFLSNAFVTASTSAVSTSTGALVVVGGAGIAGNTYVGGNVNISSGSTVKIDNNQAVNGPAFSAVLLTGQVITSGSQANIIYNGEYYDTHNCFNTTTGVFTPNVAGYYQFNWTGGANAYAASSGIVHAAMYKNNTELARGARLVANTGGIVSSGSASCYMNGTNDYVHVKFLHNSGSNATLEADAAAVANGGSYANYFNGVMVRGA